MKRSIPAIAVGLLLVVLLAVGCGGGSDESSTTGAGKQAAASTGSSGKEGESPSAGESGSGGESGSEAGSGSGGKSGGELGGGGRSGGESGGRGESAGSPSRPQSGSTSESKADFVVKVNALCAKRLQQIQTNSASVLKSSNPEASPRETLHKLADEAVVPALEAEVHDFRALEAPAEDAGKIEAIVAAVEAMVAEAQEDPRVFLNNSATSAKAQQLARAYGIGSCGKIS